MVQAINVSDFYFKGPELRDSPKEEAKPSAQTEVRKKKTNFLGPPV